MNNFKEPGFLPAFFGSFVNFKNYPEYVKRPGLSMFGHYALLVTLCCSLYAVLSTAWLNSNLSPHLDELAANVPTITVKDGKAAVDIEQPHFFEVEGQKVAIIDTTREPQEYLDKYDDIIVLSQTKLSTKEANGKIESYELPEEFSLDSATVSGWVDVAESWFLPTMFGLCFMWQICWKAVQVLVVAGIVTLVQKSRPDFTSHLKLATFALGPAMAFGVAVYALFLQGISIPAAGTIFWLILGGLTYYGSELLKKNPTYS